MPVSSITLTVAHLPSSTSFYLAALSPLGYKYIGQWGNQIGLGADGEADFFLTQEVPGLKAGATHVAFDAPTRAAVHSFFAAAIAAGAQAHGSPGARYGGDACFNAAVLDMDGNSVEVVFHESSPSRRGSAGTAGGKSVKVLDWRDGVSAANEEVIDDRSSRKTVVSVRSNRTSVPRDVAAIEDSVSAQNVLATIQQSIAGNSSGNISISPKALAGTLLGAAAGAAVAYAMCKSEEDSARQEEHAAILEAVNRQRYGAGPEERPSSSRRNSFRRIEAPPLPDMIGVGTQTFMPVPASAAPSSRREVPVEYIPFIPSNSPSRNPTVISARSARRAFAETVHETAPIGKSRPPSIYDRVSESPRAASTYDRASESPRAASTYDRVSESSQHRNSPSTVAKSEAGASRHSRKSASHAASSATATKSKVSERRLSGLPDIDETAQLAASTVSRQSYRSKKTSHSQKSSSTRRLLEENTPGSSTEQLPGFRSSDDDKDTVVPSDSISCVGGSTASHRSRRSTGSKHRSRSKESKRSSSSKQNKSKPFDRHEDLKSEPPIRKSRRSGESELGSEATMTPKTFKERSVLSLPLRNAVQSY